MIAITGVKGGCGKSTTTLGLATAFARRGTPSIAVDADRQLPDLHALAGVDRRPTLAELMREVPLGQVTQRHPRLNDAHIIAAPDSSEHVDFEHVSQRLAGSEAVLVDCPSGLGPDAVEPIAASDRAVVATTTNQSSIDGAKKTIQICRRVDTPVEGVVLTRCETVPDAVTREFNVPVLATVPERESPLTDIDVRTAYEQIADLLSREGTKSSRQGTDTAIQQRRLPTGVPALDRTHGGGVSPGTVVAIRTEGDDAADALLAKLSIERKTVYVTTDATEAEIEDRIDALRDDGRDPVIERFDEEDDPGELSDLVRKLPEGANLVIDSAGPLEANDSEAYLDLLNLLARKASETESTAFIHLDDTIESPSGAQLADMTYTLDSEDSGETAKYYLLRTPADRTDRRHEKLNVDLDIM